MPILTLDDPRYCLIKIKPSLFSQRFSAIDRGIFSHGFFSLQKGYVRKRRLSLL